MYRRENVSLIQGEERGKAICSEDRAPVYVHVCIGKTFRKKERKERKKERACCLPEQPIGERIDDGR
jgi:hypothetical protein